MLLLPRQYGYHTSWYLSRWCHLAALTETKATCQLSTTLLTVKTQGCKKMDTFKINFILIVVLMNIVYNCFSIIRDYGIGISIINWIEQWLTDRRQRVVVDGEVSNWKPVLSGVPQGSVLGPILFLIYINDLEEGVTSKILKFADDTKLFRKIKGNGDKQQLQDDIDKLIKWSEKWQMLFNFQKCKCLHAGHGNTGVNYEMGGTILCKTVKEKDLG